MFELHITKNSKLTLYLNKNSAARSKKEHYKVYGTFQEQDLTPDVQCARLGLVTNSFDLKAGCEINISLLEAGEKISLWGDFKLVDICVCSPLMIGYCLAKKHISTSLFVRVFLSCRVN